MEEAARGWAAVNGLPCNAAVGVVPGTHGRPGGPRHLPKKLIGPVSRSLDATENTPTWAREPLGYDWFASA